MGRVVSGPLDQRVRPVNECTHPDCDAASEPQRTRCAEHRRKPGRPPVAPGDRKRATLLSLSLPPALLAEVDAYADREGLTRNDGRPNRSRAIRDLVRRGLG